MKKLEKSNILKNRFRDIKNDKNWKSKHKCYITKDAERPLKSKYERE